MTLLLHATRNPWHTRVKRVLRSRALIVAAMPAEMLTGAVLMLHGPLGQYGAGDVRTGGLIMVAGSELIMAALAIVLAATLVRDRARRGTDPAADLSAYNAYLASLDP